MAWNIAKALISLALTLFISYLLSPIVIIIISVVGRLMMFNDVLIIVMIAIALICMVISLYAEVRKGFEIQTPPLT
jgi:hypothetical protein